MIALALLTANFMIGVMGFFIWLSCEGEQLRIRTAQAQKAFRREVADLLNREDALIVPPRQLATMVVFGFQDEQKTEMFGRLLKLYPEILKGQKND